MSDYCTGQCFVLKCAKIIKGGKRHNLRTAGAFWLKNVLKTLNNYQYN